MNTGRWPSSLRLRLLGTTLIALVLALTGAYWWLGSLFRDHVLNQFDTVLTRQLDQLTARLEFDAHGHPQIDPHSLSDPRWERPYSGLYWQLDRLDADGHMRSGLLRSRSLWDAQLNVGADAPPSGHLQTYDNSGPQGERLRLAERTLEVGEQAPERWRLTVAADTRETLNAVERFNGVLAASLAGLGLLLMLAALAQVAVGLAPLKAMQRALQRLHDGRAQRLEGRFPAEVQPLIDDFNGVLDRNAEVVARARAQAGNLAHALKTPLAVLGNAAEQAGPSPMTSLVTEQVQLANRHIDWHLARARAAATQRLPGQRTPLRPLLDRMLRVMTKLHADRELDLNAGEMPPGAALAVEEQDLQEMLGNLLENACRSARSAVLVTAAREGQWTRIAVDDDGRGIAPEQRAAVMQRGVRLDESRPGSGLGLAIVLDLANLYGGDLTLETSDNGGLSARLLLPAAD